MNLRLFPSTFVALLFASTAIASVPLESEFVNPPDSAKPHTWWHWCNGNITKEGITLDLEAMRRIGVVGAQIFNVAPGAAAGPVLTGSPEWRDLTKFAVTEAARVGVELAIHNCPGWSESGGPWVKPEQSMQKVVWTETHVNGPGAISATLAQPDTKKDYYRDIAVLAFPTLPGDLAQSKAVITASVPVPPEAALLDAANKKPLTLVLSATARPWVTIEFPQPVKAESLVIATHGDKVQTVGTVEASDDGKTFRKLAGLPSLKDSRVVVGFPETSARCFRFTVSAANSNRTGKVNIDHVELSGARLSGISEKAGFSSRAGIEFSKTAFPVAECVAQAQIVDLTEKLGSDGKLNWAVPAGNWTVVRIGHTSTGQTNAPAPDSGRGLECDKMSRAAVEAHFDGMMAKVIADAGPLAGKSLKMVLADSWEAGCQNWTPLMREEFKKRRGYDPVPWLITLTGRAVGTVEESERFLWDFRRTIADLIAENHYAVFQELCHKHGMLFTAEAPGIGMPTIADEIQCKSFTDVPMGEFWLHGGNDSKEPACAAHVYGRQLATAESFTAGTGDAKWMKAPFDHKLLGDLNFCRGINRYVFHRYAMQPWKDRFPGMTMGPWGTNFERTNTWWNVAGPWMQYISRCQTLLQSGLFRADVLYYYGEGAPVTITGREPKLPAGYDFDACDTGALFTRASVKEGRIVLPDGMSYSVLMLPPGERLTPAVLRRIGELAKAGATVIGERPAKSPSLSDWPHCDEEVQRLASELWGDSTAATGSHPVGKGRVIWGKALPEVFAEMNLKPDFDSDAHSVSFIHRAADGAEIYFVSNQEPNTRRVSCTFRVAGKVPELWHPETGRMEEAPAWQVKDGRTVVPIRFEPAGSVFVIFRKQGGDQNALVAVTRDGKDAFAETIEAPRTSGTLVIEKALYGVDPAHNVQCAEITEKLQSLVKKGQRSIQISNELAGDPAFNEKKHFEVKYTFNGNPTTVNGEENKLLHLPGDPDATDYRCPIPATEVVRLPDGSAAVVATQPGLIEARTVDGKTLRAAIASVPKADELFGSWELAFPPKWGAPERVSLQKLISWSEHADEGVKHFSGTATYTKEFDWTSGAEGPGLRFYLDLGSVREIAQVRLNGCDLGILWKPPFRVDATRALHLGKNRLEIAVTNLWPNRMIGDAALSKEKRYTWAAFEPFKASDPLLPSGLLGPVVIRATVQAELK